jgi:hypothetical protein
VSDLDEAGRLAEISTRLDEILRDVRKQGRAAVAAQAAAESCLEEVRALTHAAPRPAHAGEGEAESAIEGARLREGERWLRAILPLVDATIRIASEADRLVDDRSPRRGWWPFSSLGSRARDRSNATPIRDGLAVLLRQIDATLEALGVEIERPAGLVDPSRHRVVEARPSDSTPAGTILEVVRVGVRLEGRSVRDADVVAVAKSLKT